MTALTPFQHAELMVGELCREGRTIYYLNAAGGLHEFEDKHAAAWHALRSGQVASYKPKVSKVFGQFRLDLSPVEDRDSLYAVVTHWPTGVSNTLGLLRDMGEFDDIPHDREQPIRISNRALDEMESFAMANGY